jgi:hypothetical protein
MEMGRHIVFDGGPAAAAVARLLEHSSITGKVEVGYRNSMVSGGEVMILTDLVDYEWSTGEQLLWDFMDCLAGRKPVNLGPVFSYYRGMEEAPWMVEAFAQALGVTPSWERT